MKVKKGEKENTEERRVRSSKARTSLSTILTASSLLHCSVTQDHTVLF